MALDVKNNKHYELWDGTQVNDILKDQLTGEEYIGFLKGNILKYQLRLGKKDDTIKDIKKIEDYTTELNELYESLK
jgi:hypothetical protein